MTTAWAWAGSRWWKCDFHLHSPGSYDWNNGESKAASDWTDAARAKDLDAVAVTDHNTGSFVGQIQQQAQSTGRELIVFPGVELTVSGGIHLLILFSPGEDERTITAFLGRCQVPRGDYGKPEALSPCSLQEVLKRVEEHNAVCIAAHVTENKGLLRAIEPGQTLQQIVTSENLHAVEVNNHDPDLLEYVDDSKEGYKRPHGRLPLLSFSDGHALDQIGRRSTWIKMSWPDMKGLKLAFADGPMSVLPGNQTLNPNAHANLVVESIEIDSAKYMGREHPFQVRFNPWLNAIVGGRGTGKSSLIEFLRVALRREGELPERLRDEFEEFKQVSSTREDKGRLTADTKIAVVYRKDGVRYRVQWDQQGSPQPIQAEQPDGNWVASDGDIKRRFPLRMYSQKQIFELASGPESLLQVVDEATEIDYVEWEERWREAESRFLALKAQAREIEAELGEETRLKGELEDVKRKLIVFEESEHSKVLQGFQLRQRQEREVEAWREEAETVRDRLQVFAESVVVPDLETPLFDPEGEPDRIIFDAARKLTKEFDGLREQLQNAAVRASSAIEDFSSAVDSSAWHSAVDEARFDYQALIETLREEEAGDPNQYETLVQRRQDLERRLREIEQRHEAVKELRVGAEITLKTLRELRRNLTERRKTFLTKVLHGSPHVQIEVVPYGAENSVESDFRTLIGRDKPTFQNDIWSDDRQEGLLGELYKGYPDEVNEQELEIRLIALKGKVRAISTGRNDAPDVRDRRFAAHLANLTPEALDRVDTWFPGDSVKVSYSPRTDGSHFRPIAQGSPGQKTAAILAFLLSYGEEPMILDQPEDDLDNHLIYDLIVKQVRENKSRRQLIIVTHNANIVVNGDAELVLALDIRNGQTHVTEQGGLQEQAIREKICLVMEGGEEAFERRYRRIGARTRL